MYTSILYAISAENIMDSDRCIFFQLAKANQLAGKFLAQKVASLNITPVQALALSFLNEEDRVAASELGRKTELDSATLTGILDRLEAAWLIVRQNNPHDRRSILIHLTDSGKVVAMEAASDRHHIASTRHGTYRCMGVPRWSRLVFFVRRFTFVPKLLPSYIRPKP